MRRFFGILLVIILSISSTTVASSDLTPAKSEDVALSELVVTTSSSHLLLFGLIDNAFSPEMIAGLKSGIPIDFSFFVELKQKTTENWNSIVDTSFKHTLIYDTLKDQYRVELSEFANHHFMLKDLDEAMTLMSQINGVQLIELAKLQDSSTYRLRIRVDLFEQTLPLSLHYILPFVSWWDRMVDWQTLDFNYC